MRKLVALSAAVAAAGIVAVAPGVAQDRAETTIKVKANVTPNKAGTPKDPQGVTLKVHASWSSTAGVQPPVITGAKVYFPRGSLYNGGKYPKCSFNKLDKPSGTDGCPKKSIMGKADVIALADTVRTRPDVTIVNSGAKGVCLYTILYNPALVQKCVRGHLKKLSNKQGNALKGKLGFPPQYFLRIVVPEELQVVAGVPIAVRDFKSTAGGKKWAKDWLATTGCPKNKKWGFSVETFYLYVDDGFTSSSAHQDTIPCKS